jgi:hypothetical protein
VGPCGEGNVKVIFYDFRNTLHDDQALDPAGIEPVERQVNSSSRAG